MEDRHIRANTYFLENISYKIQIFQNIIQENFPQVKKYITLEIKNKN